MMVIQAGNVWLLISLRYLDWENLYTQVYPLIRMPFMGIHYSTKVTVRVYSSFFFSDFMTMTICSLIRLLLWC
ncbi:unnamed protein product [Absidia cylindrospora]